MKDFSKATPRPWEIEPHSTIDKEFSIRKTKYANILYVDYDDVDHEEQDANADLIVTAVNNFDKMKEALTTCETLLSAFNYGTEAPPARTAFLNDLKQLLESLK